MCLREHLNDWDITAVPPRLPAVQVSGTRLQLVGRFLEQYQLTPSEAAALQVSLLRALHA
jgi:hypothetical protein